MAISVDQRNNPYISNHFRISLCKDSDKRKKVAFLVAVFFVHSNNFECQIVYFYGLTDGKVLCLVKK